ncbi:MAG: GTPase Era, partial [Clostridia bacterium]|nr:GTPase Era [Clostridia bacterium]
DKIKNANKKTILIINKIDLIPKEKLLNLITLYSNEYSFSAVIPISANNSKYRNVVIEEIEKLLNVGPKYYEEDEYTDQTMRQIAEEAIREKALRLLDEEVPHGIYVEVEKYSFRKTIKKEKIYDIDAIIYCKKNSHKGIIIGKEGKMLKKIGTYARQDLEKITGMKINLKLWVKVDENWEDKGNIVKKFQYKKK